MKFYNFQHNHFSPIFFFNLSNSSSTAEAFKTDLSDREAYGDEEVEEEEEEEEEWGVLY